MTREGAYVIYDCDCLVLNYYVLTSWLSGFGFERDRRFRCVSRVCGAFFRLILAAAQGPGVSRGNFRRH